MRDYIAHYNNERPHRGLALASPAREIPQARGRPSEIARRDILGDLLHEYYPAQPERGPRARAGGAPRTAAPVIANGATAAADPQAGTAPTGASGPGATNRPTRHTEHNFRPLQESGTATEGERFELSVRQSGAQRFSRPPHSTALPPLQGDALRLDYPRDSAHASRRHQRRPVPGPRYRREAKNSLSIAPHSPASNPPATSGRWLRRGIARHVEHAAAGARLRVGRAVDHARHAREHDRPGTHRARLERHVEHRVEHAPAAERAGGLSQRDDLGVGGRVLAQLALVVSGRDQLALVGHHGSDRHILVLGCPPASRRARRMKCSSRGKKRSLIVSVGPRRKVIAASESPNTS